MSKVDAMRALREARYSGAATSPTAPARQRVAVQASPPAKAATTVVEATVGEAVCGHRNMGGKSCSREAGHEKAGTKSHRYA